MTLSGLSPVLILVCDALRTAICAAIEWRAFFALKFNHTAELGHRGAGEIRAVALKLGGPTRAAAIETVGRV